MPDLRQHFSDLDRQLAHLDMPDLLADAVRRDPRPAPDHGPSLARRVGIVLVALAVAAAATTLVVRAFRDQAARPRPAAPASPNGVIAYASIAPQRGFWTVQPDGTARTEVHVKVPGSVAIPSWSPDGRRIVFSVQSFEGIHPEGGNWDIYTANADGSDPVRLTSGKAEYAPVWSPDGTSIAYVHTTLSNDQQIWVMNADGSHPRELRGGMAPSWSPDGTKLAFVSFVGTNADIYVMNSDGSDVRRLTTDRAHEDQPMWSPDGRRIAFTREGSGDPGIYTMSPDGSGVAELIHDPSPPNLAMAWSPDGTKMAIVSMRGPGMDRNVYVLDVATGDLTAIGVPGAWWGASWQPLPTLGASPSPSATSPRITATIPVGPYPEAIAVGEGGAWVSVPAEHPSATNELVRVDPSTNRVVARIEVPTAPSSITTGYGAVWASAFERGVGKVVFRIDPSTNRVVATIRGAGGSMAVGGGSVWSAGAANENGTKSVITRIDPKTDRIVARVLLDAPAPFLAFGEGTLWAVSNTGVLRIDPATNGVIARISLQAQADVLAVGDGWVWVWGLAPSARSEGVLRIDPRTNRVTGPPIPLPNGFAPIGVDAIGVWFMIGGPVGSVARLNALTLQVDATVSLAQTPAFRVPPTAVLDPSRHTIWIADYRHSVTRIDTG